MRTTGHVRLSAYRIVPSLWRWWLIPSLLVPAHSHARPGNVTVRLNMARIKRAAKSGCHAKARN